MKLADKRLVSRAKAVVLWLLLLCAQVVSAGPEVYYPDLRLTTKGEGMYYVSASELALVLGVSVSEVESVLATGAVKLMNVGLPVARKISADGTGFCFYGKAIDTPYTAKNAYIVMWETGLDMANLPGITPASAPGGTYRHVAHMEEENMAVTGAVMDPEADFWVWDSYYADAEDLTTNNHEIVLDGVGDGGNQAVLTVRMLGWSDTGVTLEHHINIAVNSNSVGDVYWTGRTEVTNSFSFDPAVLVNGTNVITISGVADTGAEYSIVYLDYIDIAFDRNFEAVSDQLIIPGATNGIVTVTEMTGSNVYVADISSPMMPLLLAGVTIEPSNTLFTASFAPSNASTPYVIFEESAGLLVDGIATVSEVDLASASIDSEYVIITVPDLAGAAQRLADYRQGQRLNSRVVLLQDIYDQFNYGIESPYAIKQFISSAYSNWAYSLRYVLLCGSGSYDYKGVTTAVDQHVPPMLVRGEYGPIASDSWFGDIDGDWVPEVAIGRLPGVTAEDMTNLVERVIAHESEAGNAWRQTIIMVADKPDSGGNFHVSSDDVAGLIPVEYTQQKIHVVSGGEAAAHDQLLAAIDSGALFLNYLGHSGPASLGKNAIFISDDIAALSNTNRRPVITSMSCVMGRFEAPESECLGEALMLGQTGGAIAVFAPSTRAMNSDSVILSKEFYKQIFNNRESVLGDAVRAAMASYGAKKKNKNLLQFYNLLGDPALYLADVGAPTDDPYAEVIPEIVSWKTNFYSAAEIADTAITGDFSDSDQDGLTAIAEYAFGRNPTVHEMSSLVSLEKSEVVLTEDYDVVLSFSRRKGAVGVGININVTSDFASWRDNDLDIVHTQVFDNGDGITETIKHYLKAPTDVDRVFITLTVNKIK